MAVSRDFLRQIICLLYRKRVYYGGHMSMKTVTFRMRESDVDELDSYAKNLERDRTYVLNLAIEQYLERVRADHADTQAAIDEAERDGYFTLEEVTASLDAIHKKYERAARRKAS